MVKTTDGVINRAAYGTEVHV